MRNSTLTAVKIAMFGALIFGASVLVPPSVHAQSTDIEQMRAPSFRDHNRRFPKPSGEKKFAIRFVTELDSPPLSFTGPDGLVRGFNVDIAKSICEILDATCTIQELRWDFLTDSIENERADAIIAPIPLSAETRAKYGFTRRFLARPARFVSTKANRIREISPQALSEFKVAAVEGSPHLAYLRDFFPDLEVELYPDTFQAREAVKVGKIDLVFGDALTLSVWLNADASGGCCHFVGGSYLESAYFGEGISIATAPDNVELRNALDYALAETFRSDRYFEIYLRYFPAGFH